MRAREKQRRLKALARDILETMWCDCNEEGNAGDCDCGGDGIQDSLQGCWKCQAYTALNGHGTKPREET